MPITNSEIADKLTQLADLLDIEGADRFRVRAYRNAARTISTLPRSLEDMVYEGEDLTELPGVGESIAKKIREIVETGRLSKLEEEEKRTPSGLRELLRVEGLGPKRVQALYEHLQITGLADLAEAARLGRVRTLPGFGAKTEEKILRELERARVREQRTLLSVAEQFVTPLLEYLRKTEGVDRVEAAGSYRRGLETVGDLDILVTGDAPAAVMDRLASYSAVEEVVSRGETRSTVRLRSGLQVDVRAVARESYGAALVYFTGSKAHNIVLRQMAIQRGLKLSEYGAFRNDERVAGETEEEVYAALDLPWIPPELREDRGEVQAAQEGRLPRLVTREDLRGDLQSHTQDSDGRETLGTMATAAAERGLEYLAITDHSRHLAMVKGLDEEGLARQMDEIDALNEDLEGFRLLKGIEVDILEDGSLDLSDDILSRLDVVVAAVHSQFGLSRDKQTERIIRAMDNPNVHILAHPTGRLLGQREGYLVDMERLLRAAKERGCFVELNAQPQRLDLDDSACRLAKELGVKVVISTDAHTVAELDYLRFGVGQARRGWLEPDDVLNTRPWAELRAALRRA